MNNNIILAVNNIFNLFYFLIILRIFLSWIRTLNWGNSPWRELRQITDLYLDLFRRVIPPVNGLDFSPIIAIIALNIIQYVVITILRTFIA